MIKKEKILKPLKLSDNFVNILEKILQRGNSDIALELNRINISGEFLSDVTYIDRTNRDDIISFMSSDRIDRLSENEDIWNHRTRGETRIGRLIRTIFGTRYQQQSIENFVNKYKAIVRGEREFNNFEIVDGENIRYWYLSSRYYDNRGNLGGSCMQGKDAQKFLDIYVKNPNKVKLCILKSDDGNKIKGRALVWTLKTPKDYIFMDRIYVNDDADTNQFIEYAKINGWYCKHKQTYRGDDLLSPLGEKINEIKLIVDLDYNNLSRYPYMDTFRYYYYDDGYLCNSDNNDGSYYTLNDTGGYYNEFEYEDADPEVVEDWRGNEILESDAIWCELDDAYCLRTEAIYVSKGENGRGKYFIPGSPHIKYSDYSMSYYHKDDLIYSNFMKDWIYKKYSVKMYYDQNKTKWDWNHKLNTDSMGKVESDYYINTILYREEIEEENGIILSEYRFIDDEFRKLPQINDDYFRFKPDDVDIDN